jgi:hypothetical protein
MAKYNCSTMGKYMMMLKEDIKEALQGRVEGEAASKEECDKLILDSFDEAVYQLQEALAAGRTLERVAHNHGVLLNHEMFQEYSKVREEERLKYNDYKYEGKENDD